MIIIDAILTWPSGVDYPLCRAQFQIFEKYFNNVVICFYEHGTPDFTEFIKMNFPKGIFCESPAKDEKWRETAVNISLNNSTAEWVLFTEQDFFWKDDDFLDKVIAETVNSDIIGIQQGSRLHPCFLLVKRELIEKTSRDFSVKGQDKDHFSQFSKEILETGKFKDIRDLGLREGRDWYHFSSMTWNLFRIKDNNIREMHNTTDFLIYNTY